MDRVKRLLTSHHPTSTDMKIPGLKEPQILTLEFHSLDMIAVAECTSSAADRGGVAEISMTGTAVRNGNLWVFMRRKIPLKDKELTDALQTPMAAALGAVKLCGQLCRCNWCRRKASYFQLKSLRRCLKLENLHILELVGVELPMESVRLLRNGIAENNSLRYASGSLHAETKR